jgi:hypothetical protein
VNGGQIAEAAEDLLRPERYREVVAELGRVKELLGETGSSMRAAEKIYRLVRERESGSPTFDS